MNNSIIKILFVILAINNTAIGSVMSEAEESLTHAATYHWLARYKNNDANDLLKSKEYFSKALNILNISDTTHYTKLLRDKAQFGLIDTDIRYENCFDNINNEYPLFNILSGYNKTYELYDDPVVTAANYAVEDAITVIPLPIKNDFQYDVIVISEPINHELEDEIRVALNAHPQFFPRPVEDILDIISKEEYEELYNDNFSQKILNKLSKKWNKDDLLITKIINNDQVNDVSYLGIYLYEWNKKSNEIVRSVYADGLTQDRRGHISDRMIWLFFLLLLSVAFAGVSKKVFFFKEEQDRRPVYLWSGTYSFVITIIITCGLIYLFRPLAPNPTSLAILPHSRLWILCFHILIVLVPIIITYLIGVMTPKLNERLHDGETMTSLISGVGIGIFFVLFSIYVMKFPNNDLYHYIITMVILFYFYSVWTGHHLSYYFLENNKLSILPLVSFIFILEISVYCLMSNNFNLLYLADSSLILFPMFFHGFRKYSINRNLLEEKGENVGRRKEINIKSLHVQINDPEKFIDPSTSDNFVSNKVNEITENISLEGKKKLKVVLLLGQQGSGKTRMAKELANKIIKKYDSINSEGDKSGNWILFGDCDELNQSGSGVPFEPFSQALHEILGAGRFEPPAKKANKIKEGINSTGLGGILDVGGLGVLNMILGAQDEEIQPATTSEMAQIIIQTLVGLSKKRPVVFIIDDLHWIDPISYNLFKEVLNKLPEQSHANIYLIFTSRPITKINAKTQIDPVNDLTNNKTLQLLLIEDKDFQYKDKFNEILIESLHFDQRSAQKYITYTKSYGVSNILSFLQTIKSIIEDDGIKIINNKVIIRKKYDFTTLRPPTDIQNVVEQQLKTLTENQLRIIKFASFLGREFKASILSEALKMRRLHLLYDLEAMEDLGILNDVRHQDDVYEFKSNAIINVLRFMAKESEGDHNEIPQIVREYHYRVAQSIQSKMKSENNSTQLLNDQDLYSLAKRSWAAGDRMLSDAFKYNYEALLRSYNHLRYEESIEYGTNLISIIEQQNNCNQTIDNLRIHLLIAQSMIILGLDAESTDNIIEKAKLILDNSSEGIDKKLWRMVILNVEADALIHDHSGIFEKQKKEILSQINDVIVDSSHILNFEILYASLSQIRLNNDMSHKNKYEKIKSLLEDVRNSSINDKEQTETPLSGFCNDPKIDFKILESEILEELIHIMYILKVDSNDIIKHIEECEKIKSSKEVNDKDGLVLMYHYFGKCYTEIGDKEKADYYYKETINLGKKIGSDQWESRGKIGRGKLMLESGNYDDSLAEFRSVCKLKIYNDREIQYQVYIGILNISIHNNDEVLKEEFLQDAENLIQEDENKGYLYAKLQKVIAEAN